MQGLGLREDSGIRVMFGIGIRKADVQQDLEGFESRG